MNIAEFSPCRTYRYTLWREWPSPEPNLLYTSDPHLVHYPGQHHQYVQFIGLNPSTADEKNDDPTIRRCIDFAKRWGFGKLCMTNLFAFRSPKPAVMKAQIESPVGKDNNHWLLEIARSAGLVVCAWGNHGNFRQRADGVRCLLEEHGIRLMYLRMTGKNMPEHPLYIPAETELKPMPRYLCQTNQPTAETLSI